MSGVLDSGLFRVVRGGCWYVYAKYYRSAYRCSGDTDYARNDYCFRLRLPAGQ